MQAIFPTFGCYYFIQYDFSRLKFHKLVSVIRDLPFGRSFFLFKLTAVHKPKIGK